MLAPYTFTKDDMKSKILFQIPRLSVLPLSVIRYPLHVILPTDEFGPHAPPEELDSTRAAGTF